MIIDINMDSYEYLQTLCSGDPFGYIRSLEAQEDIDFAFGETDCY